MKSRTVVALLAMSFVGLVGVSLLAQPDPKGPPNDEGKFELTIPPGVYSAFVFGSLETARGKTLLVGIEGRQDFCTLIVPAGSSVILPVGTVDKPLNLMKALEVRLSEKSSRVYAFGVTAQGFMPFKAD